MGNFLGSIWNDTTRHFVEGAAYVILVSALEAFGEYLQVVPLSGVDPVYKALAVGFIMATAKKIRDSRK